MEWKRFDYVRKRYKKKDEEREKRIMIVTKTEELKKEDKRSLETRKKIKVHKVLILKISFTCDRERRRKSILKNWTRK